MYADDSQVFAAYLAQRKRSGTKARLINCSSPQSKRSARVQTPTCRQLWLALACSPCISAGGPVSPPKFEHLHFGGKVRRCTRPKGSWDVQRHHGYPHGEARWKTDELIWPWRWVPTWPPPPWLRNGSKDRGHCVSSVPHLVREKFCSVVNISVSNFSFCCSSQFLFQF